jgi:hypothetical protein
MIFRLFSDGIYHAINLERIASISSRNWITREGGFLKDGKYVLGIQYEGEIELEYIVDDEVRLEFFRAYNPDILEPR